jgi:hypothetical protein
MTIEINPVTSAKETQAQNSVWDSGVDINLMRDPKRMIHIFTVAKRAFTINRPPLHPIVHVPACGPAERWKPVMHVPDPFTQGVRSTESWQLEGKAHDGWRVAIDLLNPNNITTNPDWECPDTYKGLIATGYGCDLFEQGLFLSLSEVPSEAEIAKAESRRHKYYERLRRQIETMQDADVKVAVQSNQDFDLMADYFGIEYSWHKRMTAMVSCPNCQEKIAMGAAWHVSGGVHCVNDWKKAVDAGIKKKEDVPDAKKWWTDSNLQGSKHGGGGKA